MLSTKFDISVILTAHHEGRLAHRSMRSLFRTVEYAKSNGLSVEISVVQDRPNEETKDYFSRYDKSEVHVRKVDFGDPGLSRNYGVKCSSGKYIAFLDGDDLFGKDWLYKAFRYLEDNNEKEVVVHPEYHVGFEADNLIWRQISSSDYNFKAQNLIEFNYWAAVCVAKRDVLLRHPYQETSEGSGFGFEDWHFNCETLAWGIEHHVVPETVHFLRMKKTDSRFQYESQSNRVIRPTKLFEPAILSSVVEKEKKQREKGVNKTDGRMNQRERTGVNRLYLFINKMIQRNYRALSLRFDPVFKLFPRLHMFAKIILKTNKISMANVKWNILLPEWKAIHKIEPQLFPETKLLRTLNVHHLPPVTRMAQHYLELCRLYGEGVSHVFLVPWLERGGADLATLNYINALVKNNLASGVVVISTLNADSPWAKRLPEGVRFIEFGKMCSALSFPEQELLLVRLLLQEAPKVIHNINSYLAYKVFVKYGKALQSISRLYATIFCKDITEEGKTVGYPFMYLPECFDYLKAVSCENHSFLEELERIYTFEKEKLYVLFTPTKIFQKSSFKSSMVEKKQFDILWAGRIDRQKRPDILIKIAEACSALPFKFHVYGASLLSKDIYTEKLKRLKNVQYHGSFDGLSSLPSEECDLFLYTSQWDGIPTVLLWAMSKCLPVVAPNVGGVGELVIHNKTGFLIDPYDDVKAYANCLETIYHDRPSLKKIVDNAYDLVSARHSPEKFLESLKKFPGYVINNDKLLDKTDKQDKKKDCAVFNVN